MADQHECVGYQTDIILSDLENIRQHGLYRKARAITGRGAAEIFVDGQTLVNFSSNDYLGFSKHKKIREAINDASVRHGIGSGASPMICGRTGLHQELEKKLARVTGRDKALLFSCGYMANLGIIQGLTGASKHHIYMDKLCHASMVDGVILSRSKYNRYQHASSNALNTMLEAADGGQKLVLTESVFSMDGDLAPLPELSALCRDYGACLIVDDAHGFGVLGESGMGAMEQFQLTQQEVPLMMATFGKALGVHGAFVAGKEELIEALVQRARTYIYSTSMPVCNVAGVIQALDLLHEESYRRDDLKSHVAYFQQGLIAMGKGNSQQFSPIHPLLIGSPEKTIELSSLLEQQGIYVTAIRPPTVPKGTSRLRITLTATHTRDQVSRLLQALKATMSLVEASR